MVPPIIENGARLTAARRIGAILPPTVRQLTTLRLERTGLRPPIRRLIGRMVP